MKFYGKKNTIFIDIGNAGIHLIENKPKYIVYDHNYMQACAKILFQFSEN